MRHEHSSVDLWPAQWKEPQSGCRDTKTSRCSFGEGDVLERLIFVTTQIFIFQDVVTVLLRVQAWIACSQRAIARVHSNAERAPPSLISTPPFRFRENLPKVLSSPMQQATSPHAPDNAFVFDGEFAAVCFFSSFFFSSPHTVLILPTAISRRP